MQHMGVALHEKETEVSTFQVGQPVTPKTRPGVPPEARFERDPYFTGPEFAEDVYSKRNRLFRKKPPASRNGYTENGPVWPDVVNALPGVHVEDVVIQRENGSPERVKSTRLEVDLGQVHENNRPRVLQFFYRWGDFGNGNGKAPERVIRYVMGPNGFGSDRLALPSSKSNSREWIAIPIAAFRAATGAGFIPRPDSTRNQREILDKFNRMKIEGELPNFSRLEVVFPEPVPIRSRSNGRTPNNG